MRPAKNAALVRPLNQPRQQLASGTHKLYFFQMSASHQPLPDVSWFDVSDPNSLELDKLAERFGFHELQVEDCRHRPQRAKMEEYET